MTTCKWIRCVTALACLGPTATVAQAQTAPTTSAEPASSTSAPPPSPAVPAAAAGAPPSRLAVGSSDGFSRPGILLQGWYVADFLGASADEIDNTFRIRRAELSAQGEIVPGWVRYKLRPCVRVGYLDPNIDADGTDATDELWQVDAGLNWLVQADEVKLQLAYARLQHDDRTPGNQLTLNARASF